MLITCAYHHLLSNSTMEESSLESARDLLKRRRDLLPKWIKFFIWVFFVFGAFIPLILLLPLFGISIGEISIYGLASTTPYSVTGLIVVALFALKAGVSYGLWTEQKWGVDLARLDGTIGIIVCVITTLVLPFIDAENGINVSFRLEILLLIPYIWKMRGINLEWVEREKF